MPTPPERFPWTEAIALALGAALSLGLARFAYALQLPAMRADLGWTYFSAGALHTANAAGYLLGALAMPVLMRRMPARRLFLLGAWLALPLLALHAWVRGETLLALIRLLLGASSALTFVAGGVLAARLGQRGRASLVLGLYYGGTGLGIVAAALLLPPLLEPAARWPWSWLLLAALAALALAGMARGTAAQAKAAAAPPRAGHAGFRWPDFGFGLASYTSFGLGYIGTMTFNITLLLEAGLGQGLVSSYFLLLGLGCLASSWLWAGLLARSRGGGAMALLNALLALATLLPVFLKTPWAVLAAGLLFGAVFLQVVASTTALVRHNLPPEAWPAGISAFTVVFAAGQIVGPSLVGWVADGGGLARGLLVSSGLLAGGALLALLQRPVLRHSRP